MSRIYSENYKRIIKLQADEIDKYKKVLYKIKEYVEELEEDYPDYDGEIVIGDISDKAKKDILELLEEIK